ncbi:hypothetical protein [Ramlibacter albus]|uniref:Uncharacterized protein n=1 Tax=Ramlibacter albus TaxID=2079448 RepID=A0A923M955_9BURK|nr:hypothetical protein [Ramlibacter albus]MBC5765044.1 hypothetical protein [Ramlibacter albus]
MRFAAPDFSKQTPPPVDRALADAAEGAPRSMASTSPPWPADSPPDDLDERVRLAGEWQVGEW